MSSVLTTTSRLRAALAIAIALSLAIPLLATTPAGAGEECIADAENDVLDRVTGNVGADNPRADLLAVCANFLAQPPAGGQPLTLSARVGEASDIATDPAWQPGRSALVFEVRTDVVPGEGADVERDFDVIVGRAAGQPAYTVRDAATGETTCPTRALPADALPTGENPLLTVAFDPAECLSTDGRAPSNVAVAAYLFFTEEGGNSLIDEVPPNAQGYGSTLNDQPSGTVGYDAVLRAAGADRVETAIEVSKVLYADGAPNSARAAVLATSLAFPDALSAAPLAVHVDGPLLLTPTSRLHEAVEAELERVLTEPGMTVYLVGGPQALSPAVADAVARLGHTPVRLSGGEGTGRHETALAVAREIDENPARVVLADGGTYHMPLLGATYAAATNNLRSYDDSNRPAGNAVLLLSGGPDAYQQALLEFLFPQRQGREYVVVGSLASQFADANGLAVTEANRLVAPGDNPFTTADRVARRFDGANAITPPTTEDGTPAQTEGSPNPVRAIEPPRFAAVVTATSFADAVPAAALAGVHGAPLLFSWRDTIPQSTRALLAEDMFDDLGTGFVVGGTAALSNLVARQLDTCVRTDDHSTTACRAG